MLHPLHIRRFSIWRWGVGVSENKAQIFAVRSVERKGRAGQKGFAINFLLADGAQVSSHLFGLGGICPRFLDEQICLAQSAPAFVKKRPCASGCVFLPRRVFSVFFFLHPVCVRFAGFCSRAVARAACSGLKEIPFLGQSGRNVHFLSFQREAVGGGRGQGGQKAGEPCRPQGFQCRKTFENNLAVAAGAARKQGQPAGPSEVFRF